ncbi:MAG: GFA family protein [Deltaproteobacteria bacterium]|nr:GFA family protein [Deltaproteobacteria bacterium]
MPIQRGSCHCGAVRFEAEGELQGLEVCNCSYCARAGFVHWYVAPERFRVLAGEDTLVDYQFGTHTSHNLFCPTCGVTPFRRARSDPRQIDVNVRCLEGVDADALPTRPFDGRDWEQGMRNRQR